MAVIGAVFVLYLLHFRQTIGLYFPLLLQATGVTLLISLVSMILATFLGGLAVWGRLSRRRVWRWLAIAYVEGIRGTPTLVQLLLWGFGIGTLLSRLGFDPHGLAFQLMTPLQSNSLVPANFNFIFYGVLGLGFNYGAYLTEVFRAGIASVDKGQREAALSLGMEPIWILRRVVLPQAIRLVIPPLYQ